MRLRHQSDLIEEAANSMSINDISGSLSEAYSTKCLPGSKSCVSPEVFNRYRIPLKSGSLLLCCGWTNKVDFVVVVSVLILNRRRIQGGADSVS